MIFSRKTDDNLAGLVKKLDSAMKDNEHLRAVVHLLGEDRDELLETAAAYKTEAIPVTVPVEFESGPANWSINPEADLTVFTYRGKKIASSHGFTDVSDKDIDAVLTSVTKLVKEGDSKDSSKKGKKAKKSKG